MTRRTVLGGAALLARRWEWDDVSMADMADGLKSGRHSARGLVEQYLRRIEAIDRRGPLLRSVIEVNPEALSIAEGLDRERKKGAVRSPLHGVPILIKDNIDTADRMSTTAGSLALVGSRPARDAFVVERLRAAGAVLLGKTNLSEWANIRSSRSVSGWSGRGGQTRNPHVLDRNPSGSSSGSGAAVAANLCAAAVGTETDGSIVSPASTCGIVGIKPTLGLVSRAGIIPIAHSQDTAGPMARTVRDAAMLLTALAGADPRDPQTVNRPAQDFAQFCVAGGLKGARLGVPRKGFENSPQVNRVLEDCLAAMKREGAEVIDPAELPNQEKLSEHEIDVLLYELKADLNAYLQKRGAAVKSLAEVIAFNERERAREMPYFGQELFLRAEAKGPLTEQRYIDALGANQRFSREEGIDALVRAQRLDAIVAITSGPACFTDWVNGDRDTGGCSQPAAVAGYPHITVPGGFVHGLPVGVSFFGPAWSEDKLIRIAYGFEQATKARRAPRFLPSAGFET